jgi:hypothetical protein
VRYETVVEGNYCESSVQKQKTNKRNRKHIYRKESKREGEGRITLHETGVGGMSR